MTGDTLQVTGTDLDLTITVETAVNGGADGVAVAPGRLITDIVRALEPGAVAVEADDEEIRIASGRSHFTVRTHPAGDFPRLAGPDRRHGDAARGGPHRGAASGDPGGVQRGLAARSSPGC